MSNKTGTTVPGNGETATEEKYEVVSENIRLPLAEVRMFEGQPRKFFDQAALRDLAASIRARGQTTPIRVMRLEKPVGKIKSEAVDGQRRYMAHELLKSTHLVATIVKVRDKKDQFIQSCIANFGQYPHTMLEKVLAAKRLHEEYKQKPSDIATVFVCNVGYIYSLLKAGEADIAILERLDPKRPENERLTFPVLLMLAPLPRDMQHKLAPQVAGTIPVYKARDIIHTATKAAGIQIGSGQNARTPRCDWNMVTGFVRRTSEQAGIFAKKPDEYFDAICASRTKGEVDRVVIELEQGIQRLQSLKAALKKRATENRTGGNGATNNAWLLEHKSAPAAERRAPPPETRNIPPVAVIPTEAIETRVVLKQPEKVRADVQTSTVQQSAKPERKHLTHKQRMAMEKSGGLLKKPAPREFPVPVDVPLLPFVAAPTATELRDKKRGYTAGTKIPTMHVD
ncbi:MAG: ParB N-terminal domain-containing protein [Candidatus Pacebacteria bacterium]|nr:ParB N-terminal domain-containing protein [Candidatus Paceibacterota bacterium]